MAPAASRNSPSFACKCEDISPTRQHSCNDTKNQGFRRLSEGQIGFCIPQPGEAGPSNWPGRPCSLDESFVSVEFDCAGNATRDTRPSLYETAAKADASIGAPCESGKELRVQQRSAGSRRGSDEDFAVVRRGELQAEGMRQASNGSFTVPCESMLSGDKAVKVAAAGDQMSWEEEVLFHFPPSLASQPANNHSSDKKSTASAKS